MADVVLANSAADLTGATLAKVQNASANSKLVGSGTAGSGSPYTEITLGTNLSMSGTTLNASGGASTTSPTNLGTYSVSASGVLDMVTRNAAGTSGALFQSDFTIYKFYFVNILPASDNVHLYLRLSEDGGATYRATAGDYFYSAFLFNNVPTTGVFNDGTYGSTACMIAPGVDSTDVAALTGVSGELTIYRPTTAERHKITWDTSFENNSSRGERQFGMGWYSRANAVTAARLLFHSGNIASSSVTVVGIP